MLKRLGDTCTFVGGGTPSKKNPDFYKGSIPWATVRDMNVRVIETTEHSITSEAVRQSATNIIPNGEIVISTHVGLGKICFLGQDTAINQDLKAVIPNGELSRRYLYYWFISKTDELIANGKGATVKGVTLDFVKNLKIQVLTEREQEVISDTLDKVHNVIELADAQVSRLNQLVKSRFVEMFGDELEQGRWPPTTVGEVANVCVGVVIKPTQYYQESGVKAFRSLNIGEMMVKDDEWVFFSETGNAKNQKSVVHRNDVLVVRSGAPGTACVVPERFDGCNAVDIIIARPDCNKVDPTFLAMFTNMPHGKNQIRNQIGGAAQQHYNVGGYKKLQLIDPPLALQREFAAFVEKVDKLAFAARRRRDVARQLYRAKIQEFFG